MSEAIDIGLDIARRCMLRAPVAGLLDQIVVMDPVKRCIAVAQAINQTIGTDSPYAADLESVGSGGVNQELGQDVRDSAVFDGLKAEALARHSGQRPEMPALLLNLVQQHRSAQRV